MVSKDVNFLSITNNEGEGLAEWKFGFFYSGEKERRQFEDTGEE